MVEWRKAGAHFVDEDAERPPIDGAVVALVFDNLGSDVLGRAAKCPRALVRPQAFRKTEIRKLLQKTILC